ncbi:recombination associated protein RdgC [Noviherbaspirillum humi]|uniref:Recombination-associated protein RdgC n=1 Tax=Noviherbaspirillum humi TaxID=1688639 RepID=A0A239BWL7_9BURK|nr:recombination-associated protein RdgC [Noviherbaspirillum humi]SNS12296.1 recombination associated protein RdgC [Noviherbaspirillum humi]
MWFKNLQIYRLSAPWTVVGDALEAALAKQAFAPCSSADMETRGWVSPRNNGMLSHTVNRQILLQLGTERKLLPSSVINQVSKERAAELEEQQGFKPGRKQMKEIKEQVADELLPRAFSIRRSTSVWIDPVNNWLVVDAASPAKADEVFKTLLKCLDQLPVGTLRVARSPVAAMTDWLAADEAPYNFTVDQDTELRASSQDKATVRYVRHTLEADDVRRHIAAGKQCTRLAMTWNDRVSIVLTESLAIKRVAPLDVLKENNDSTTQNDEERFDTDFALMTGELGKLLNDLVDALGGEVPEGALAAPAASGEKLAA